MKSRPPWVTPVVISILVGISAGLVRGSTPAFANSLVIPVWGTVEGLPESVSLSGLAHITSSRVVDPDLGSPPAVILHITLWDVFGEGLFTRATYISTGENVLIRPLVASDLIEVTFPFFPAGPGGASLARSAVASFTLNFDIASGDVTTAIANFATPHFRGRR